MSVETQAGDSPGNGVVQQLEVNNPVVMREIPTPDEEMKQTLQDEAIPSEDEGVIKTLNISPKEESPSAARTWFESLSSEERLSTLGFMDGPFLLMLLELASWSPAKTETQEADTEGFVAGNGINWATSVSIKQVKDMYITMEDGSNNSDARTDSGIESTDVEAEDFVSKTEDATLEQQNTEPVDSDAFRIRGESEDKSSDSGNEVAETGDSLRFALAIFDQICVVFPSAFKHVSGTVLDERFPYVTMSPSYLDKTSDEELLLAFDAVARAAFGTQFLQHEPSASESSFMTLFQGLDSSVEETKMPQYALLLSRFQMAVFEAFNKHQKNLSKAEHISVDVALLGSNEMKEVSRHQSDSSENHITDVQKKVESYGEGAQLSELMGDVVSHAHAMDDLAVAIDTDTLKGLMAPFVGICFAEGVSFSSGQLEHLVLTPLSWLLHARQKSGAVDFESWDIALQLALKRMSQHGTSIEAPQIDMNEATPASDDILQADSLTKTLAVSEAVVENGVVVIAVSEAVVENGVVAIAVSEAVVENGTVTIAVSEAVVENGTVTIAVSETVVVGHDAVTIATVGGQKKKKKSRRRRKRKTSNADTVASVTKEQSITGPDVKVDHNEPGVEEEGPIPIVVETSKEEVEVEVEGPKEEVEASKEEVEVEIEAPKEEVEIEAPKEEVEVEAPKEEVEIEAPKEEVEVEAPKEEVEVEAPKEEVHLPEVEDEVSKKVVQAPEVEEQVQASEVKVETANGEDEVSKEQVQASEMKVETANEEDEVSKEQVQASEVKVETAKEEVQASKEEVETSKEQVQASKEEVETSTEQVDTKAEVEIGTNHSRDTDDTEAETTLSSVSGETFSVEGNLQAGGSAASGKDDITISRVEGVPVVAAHLSEQPSNLKHESIVEGASAEEQTSMTETGDAWETVEVRLRGSRKKPGERSNHSGSRKAYHASHSAISMADGSTSKRGKSTRTPASRKKIANRKMARDILASVLDRVDEEVHRKKQSPPPPPPPPSSAGANPWKRGSPFVKPVPAAVRDNVEGKKAKTLRDVVLGKQAGASAKPVVAPAFSRNEAKTRLSETAKSFSSKSTSINWSKGKALSPADQNTAPTYQETVSATSAGSNVDPGPKRGVSKLDSPVSKNDAEVAPPPSAKQSFPAPPLPTLLSPKSVTSANSSVASSLEVPHSRRHHSNSAGDVNDVGYHLLDVCDRLSGDMCLFMSRRALALNSRRQERGALLSVLQDTVAGLWPDRCHVEMYGSCATQLDLPSSDLDVVVRGMDHSVEVSAPPTPQGTVRSMSIGSESLNMSQGMEDQGFGFADELPQHAQAHHLPASFIPMSVHMNGERVRRLAAALEQQPWAVKVNAIPTASVPVVKVLADPSRLPGISSTIQHQQLAAQAAVASGHGQAPVPSEDPSAGGHPSSRQNLHPPHAPQPWRGADVMNGLLSLDITFEGPEHGGIGSTELSAQAVTEMCQATGLMPDATPFVQVLMVLKELLAQRKLNEPFSGGLSSYAVLLLVVALVRERAVIREEIERVERQRKAVAAGDVTAFVGTPLPTVNDSKKLPQNFRSSQVKKENAGKSTKAAGNKAKKGNKASKTAEQPARRATPGTPRSSSWASIANKTSNLEDSKQPVNTLQSRQTQKTTPKISHKPSFADAVAKSNPVATKTNATVHKKKVATGPQAEAVAREPASAGRKSRDTDFTVKEAPKTRPTPSNTVSTKEQTRTEMQPSMGAMPSYFPQGYNDIIEVLCSGEITAGKLLMHFLLYYGQHFDAQGTAIDVSGKHDRSFMGQYSPYAHLSSFIQRAAPGTIDPVTGMLTVDPIVIYDPLEGVENNNVARRCFAWNSIRWIFAQSYATLSSAVERSATPPPSPGGGGKTSSTGAGIGNSGRELDSSAVANDPDGDCDLLDPSSPLLRCLLSF